jgi:hypothetical protein
MKIPKKFRRPISVTAAKFAFAFIAALLLIGYLQHGKLKIGNWLNIDIPAVAGGKGGDAIAEAGGRASGGPGGPAGAIGPGGVGGDARASGAQSVAVGGPGGRGGIGPGQEGGSVQAGLGVTAAGGEGGEAGQPGGRGGRSGAEVIGIPNVQLPDGTWLWDYGRGGNGGSISVDQGGRPERSFTASLRASSVLHAPGLDPRR